MKNNHPHYDSDRKKATEKFSISMIGWSFIAIVTMLILMLFAQTAKAQDTIQNICEHKKNSPKSLRM